MVEDFFQTKNKSCKGAWDVEVYNHGRNHGSSIRRRMDGNSKLVVTEGNWQVKRLKGPED